MGYKVKLFGDLAGLSAFSLVFLPLLASFAFVSWYPLFSVPFLNDDFQILGWLNPQTFLDCFKPLWSPDVSVHYWRPVVNTIHSLNIWLFGLEPFSFRLISFLIYLFCCFAFGYLLRSLGISSFIAIIASVFFTVLPSHELQAAWLACRGDTLMTFFILLYIINLKKAVEEDRKRHWIMSFTFFLLAILCKEHAWAAAALPFLFLMSVKPVKLKKALLLFLLNIFIIIIVLLYRYIVIGGLPFGSPNYSEFNFFRMLINLGLYIPASLISVSLAETLNRFYIIFPVIILFLVIIFYLLKTKEISDINKRNMIFGMNLFMLFVIPVLPLFMRWYAFLPSIGIVIIISTLLQIEHLYWKKWLLTILLLVTSILMLPININQMNNWKKAGFELNSLLNAVKQVNLRENSTVYVWCTPDKIDGINTMKIGVEQAIKYTTGLKNINVLSPLRFEAGQDFTLIYKKISQNEFLIFGKDLTFFPPFAATTFDSHNRIFEIKDSNYELKIRNSVNKNGMEATASVKLTINDNHSIHLVFGRNNVTAFRN